MLFYFHFCLCGCLCLCDMCVLVSTNAREMITYSGPGAVGGCDLPEWMLGAKPKSSENHQVLLTIELCLQVLNRNSQSRSFVSCAFWGCYAGDLTSSWISFPNVEGVNSTSLSTEKRCCTNKPGSCPYKLL